MKKYTITKNNLNFVIYDYEDGLKPEIYYEKDNVLYDEGNGFPSGVDVVPTYLYVCDYWKELI